MDLLAFDKISALTKEYGARLVAVSKTRTIEEIKALYDHGHRIFGENRLSEITKKKALLPDDIEWHLIGPLQSKKVKYYEEDIALFHALERPKIWKLLNQWAEERNIVIDALIQIHIAQEETKHGFLYDELSELLSTGVHLNWRGVRLRGLMGMATFTTDESVIREEFSSLQRYFTELKNTHFTEDHFSEISMGMSSDYKLALECGATLIRVGSSIFGQRVYK
jgi:pyridoxal phosphate enzyme (YggS family)